MSDALGRLPEADSHRSGTAGRWSTPNGVITRGLDDEPPGLLHPGGGLPAVHAPTSRSAATGRSSRSRPSFSWRWRPRWSPSRSPSSAATTHDEGLGLTRRARTRSGHRTRRVRFNGRSGRGRPPAARSRRSPRRSATPGFAGRAGRRAEPGTSRGFSHGHSQIPRSCGAGSRCSHSRWHPPGLAADPHSRLKFHRALAPAREMPPASRATRGWIEYGRPMTLLPQLSQQPNARAKTRRRTLADGPASRR